MKNLWADDRPREKLWRHGVSALGDNELVALILGSGCRHRGALALANEVLAARGGVQWVVRSTCDDLARIVGIGRAKASRIIGALELGRRTLARAPGARIQPRTPRDAAAYLMPSFGSWPVEQLDLVLLDAKHRVLRTAMVAISSLNATVVQTAQRVPRSGTRRCLRSRCLP